MQTNPKARPASTVDDLATKHAEEKIEIAKLSEERRRLAKVIAPSLAQIVGVAPEVDVAHIAMRRDDDVRLTAYARHLDILIEGKTRLIEAEREDADEAAARAAALARDGRLRRLSSHFATVDDVALHFTARLPMQRTIITTSAGEFEALYGALVFIDRATWTAIKSEVTKVIALEGFDTWGSFDSILDLVKSKMTPLEREMGEATLREHVKDFVDGVQDLRLLLRWGDATAPNAIVNRDDADHVRARANAMHDGDPVAARSFWRRVDAERVAAFVEARDPVAPTEAA